LFYYIAVVNITLDDCTVAEVMEQNLITEYKNTGILLPQLGFSRETVGAWLHKINNNYIADSSEREGGRRYVSADKLYELGILQEVLTNELQQLILSLIPNPVLFHCHAYSIPHSEFKNHIGFHHKSGWHRDHVESGVSENGVSAFSLFLYLTDVTHEDNGVFELVPSYFQGDNIWGKKSIRFKGDSGFCFLWDRSLYHRPHPNKASFSREIIKISVHSNGYPNSRINLPEFKKLKEMSAGKHPLINYLSGDKFSGSSDFVPFLRNNNAQNLPKNNDSYTNARAFYRPKVTPLIKRVVSKFKLP
jgi:hypothetical protein